MLRGAQTNIDNIDYTVVYYMADITKQTTNQKQIEKTIYTPEGWHRTWSHDGLVQMIFLSQGARILRFQPLIFQGV